MKTIIRALVKKTRKKWLHIMESQENFNLFMNGVCLKVAFAVIILSGFVVHH